MASQQGSRQWKTGVDIGGTFTDVVFLNDKTGELVLSKVPSTPDDYSIGVNTGLNAVGESLGSINFFTHGTTVGVNALLQDDLCKMGVVTTKGFRDVLEIGRSNRIDVYDSLYSMPKPLVPRKLRKEVTERIDRRGEVLEPLDEDEVLRVVREFEKEGVEGIAVCLINSYANPIHEDRIKDIIQSHSSVLVCVSSDITREYREYERTSTTVINLGVMPAMKRYLTALQRKLASRELHTDLHIMQSNGGLMKAREAINRPVYTIRSSLAGGMSGMLRLSEACGRTNLVGADMGGTSFDAEIVAEGKAETIPFFKISTPKSGRDGYPVMTPTLDVHSIGAGGGSIVWIDNVGQLHVGPRSAGADPGPVCYGKGGKEPTVTDANLLLGRLNPHYLLGGEMKVHYSLAEESFKEVANRLGMKVTDLAYGVVKIAVKLMATAIRNTMLRKGLDPRDFTLVAFGGCGPMHAAHIAEELSIPEIIVPTSPGNFSAWGMLMADLRHDFVQTYVISFKELNVEDIESVFSHMEEEGGRRLQEEDIPEEERAFVRSLDVRYVGQEHALNLPILNQEISRSSLVELGHRFDQKHKETYLHSAPEEPKEVANIRVTAIGRVKKPRLKELGKAGEKTEYAERSVYFDEEGFVKCPIYERSALSNGHSFCGPIIVQETTSTTMVLPSQEMMVDKFGNLVITFQGGTNQSEKDQS